MDGHGSSHQRVREVRRVDRPWCDGRSLRCLFASNCYTAVMRLVAALERTFKPEPSRRPRRSRFQS
jgi:hypothetical protein